jgi:hypothetical protein
MRGLEDNVRAIENIWKDPVARVKYFFDEAPYHSFRGKGQSVEAYQLGTYLALWGELYGFPSGVREIAATGRGTGKTTIFQELNAADMAVFMPYFLQTFYGEKKPIDVTLIFVANVKKGARQRLENVKRKISGNAYLDGILSIYTLGRKRRLFYAMAPCSALNRHQTGCAVITASISMARSYTCATSLHFGAALSAWTARSSLRKLQNNHSAQR